MAGNPSEYDYTDRYFPSMQNTTQNHAQNHRQWLHSSIYNTRGDFYKRARDAINLSQGFTNPQLPPLPTGSQPDTKTIIRLCQNDTFSEVHEIYRKHPNDSIGCLNHANASVPGGGWLQGGTAQEEDLCHCSTLYDTLRPALYPMRDNEIIYSPDVLITHANVNRVYNLLPVNERIYINVISCAAKSMPHDRLMLDPYAGTRGPRETYRFDADRQLMRSKIRMILNLAVQQNIRRLVIGAIGCGRFHNPTWEVAALMKEELLGDATAPPTDWARFGLLEIAIAIYDPVTGTPMWNAFLNEFKDVNGDIDIGQQPSHDIQYTVFPANYVVQDGSLSTAPTTG